MERKVTASVEIDGKAISPINSLSIQQPMNGHHSFELRCPVREKEKSLADAGNNFIGKEIKIELAAGAVKSAKNLFKGIITNVSLSKTHGSANEIIYYGHSPTILMDDGQHCQSFEEKSLDKIASDVAAKFSVAIKAEPAHKGVLPYTVQYRETGFQFLNRLASVFGEWFFYSGTDLIFGKAPKETPVELQFGRDLSNFNLALNLMPVKFKQLGYDHLGHQFPESPSSAASVSGLDDFGKIASGASDRLFTNEPLSATIEEVQDKADLDGLTKHKKASKAGNFVVFNGTSDNNQVKLGSIINVKGKIGELGNTSGSDVAYGEYRVIRISHSTDSLGNYQNNFKAVPSGLAEPPVNNAIVHPVCEIQPAEVLENHDPKSLGRVRVQCLWQKPSGDKTPWIRVAASGAGGSHGAYFVPEKGDSVLVAFEHNNPNKPYVIGSLYHGKSKPADGLSDPDNNKKSIKTKSGNQITLTDKGGKEEIKIENKTNVITLTMDGDLKITISTAGNMLLNAKNIALNATETISITAGKTVAAMAGEKESLVLDKEEKAVILAGTNATVSGKEKADVTSDTTNVDGKKAVNITGKVVKLNS